MMCFDMLAFAVSLMKMCALQFKGKPVLTHLAGAAWSAVRLTKGYGYIKVTVERRRLGEAEGGEAMERLTCQYIDVGEQRWQACSPGRHCQRGHWLKYLSLTVSP